jgi:hypothetical protein
MIQQLFNRAQISNPQLMAIVKEVDGEYELAVNEMQE